MNMMSNKIGDFIVKEELWNLVSRIAITQFEEWCILVNDVLFAIFFLTVLLLVLYKY